MFSVELAAAGVIISPSYILTCAHCVAWYEENQSKTENTTLYWLYIGEHVSHQSSILSPLPQKDLIEEIIVHPDWDRRGLQDLLFTHDFALLKLKSPLEYSATIRPICLPASNNTMYERQWVKAIGWGGTNRMYSFFIYRFLEHCIMHYGWRAPVTIVNVTSV